MNKVSTVTMLSKADDIKLNLPRLECQNLNNELAFIRWKVSEYSGAPLCLGCLSTDSTNVRPSFKRALNTLTHEELAELYLHHWVAIEQYLHREPGSPRKKLVKEAL